MVGVPALGESEPTSFERGLLDGLRARLEKKTASELAPGAKEPFASQKMGVEAILSALLLNGSADGRRAFDRLWSDPWEMPESGFYGSALAALAVGSAPAEYQREPEVRKHIDALTEYLQREQPSKPLHNRLMLLWASSKLPATGPTSSVVTFTD